MSERIRINQKLHNWIREKIGNSNLTPSDIIVDAIGLDESYKYVAYRRERYD